MFHIIILEFWFLFGRIYWIVTHLFVWFAYFFLDIFSFKLRLYLCFIYTSLIIILLKLIYLYIILLPLYNQRHFVMMYKFIFILIHYVILKILCTHFVLHPNVAVILIHDIFIKGRGIENMFVQQRYSFFIGISR